MRKKKLATKKGQKWRNEDIIKCCNPAHFIHGLRGISCRDMYCFQIIRAVRSTHFCNRTTHCVTCKLMFCHLIHAWRGMILYHTLLVNTEAPQMSALRIRIRVCLERNELFLCAPPLPRQKYHIFVLFYLFRFVSFCFVFPISFLSSVGNDTCDNCRIRLVSSYLLLPRGDRQKWRIHFIERIKRTQPHD